MLSLVPCLSLAQEAIHSRTAHALTHYLIHFHTNRSLTHSPHTYAWKVGPSPSTSALCLTTVRCSVKAIVVVHRKEATQKNCVA